MKKFLVILAVVMVVVAGGTLALIGTGCITSEITHESKTTEMRMENPQTGEVDWIDLED